MPAAGTCSQFENRPTAMACMLACHLLRSQHSISTRLEILHHLSFSLAESCKRIKYNYSPGYSPKNRILAHCFNVLSTLEGTSGRLDTTLGLNREGTENQVQTKNGGSLGGTAQEVHAGYVGLFKFKLILNYHFCILLH